MAWEVDTLIDRSRSYTITGAPRVVKGKVIIGNGGGDMTGVRGYVTAYDANTGKLAWRFYTVPGDPKLPPEDDAMALASKTWFGDTYWKTGGGGTVWDSMAYDPDLNLLYIGVDNGYYWNYQMRSEGKGDNLFLSSIVALDPDTGKYVWHYQTTPGEMWDFSSTQHMILADLFIDGKVAKVLLQAPKNGFFYVIDRATGKLISAEKYATANWASHVDLDTGRPVQTGDANYNTGPKLVTPSPFGAHSWQPMSFNPATGLVYLPMQDSAAMLSAGSVRDVQPHSKLLLDTGTDFGTTPEDPAVVKPMLDSMLKGKLLAWDPIKQKALWSVDFPTMPNGGTLTTAGNLVFEGTATGRIRAYAADTGKLLWDAPANTGVVAGPVTYTVKGEQYVTFMAGWGGGAALVLGPFAARAGVKADARILTFKLGGQAPMPAPRPSFDPLPEPPALTGDEAQVGRGRKLYNDTCFRCHGATAVGGGVLPDLRYLGKEKHAMFAAIVRGMRIDKGMPAFGANVLSNDDVADIQQYLIRRSHDLKTELGKQP
jgi:quinohemoprotein ethanol dehydrogenase